MADLQDVGANIYTAVKEPPLAVNAGITREQHVKAAILKDGTRSNRR